MSLRAHTHTHWYLDSWYFILVFHNSSPFIFPTAFHLLREREREIQQFFAFSCSFATAWFNKNENRVISVFAFAQLPERNLNYFKCVSTDSATKVDPIKWKFIKSVQHQILLLCDLIMNSIWYMNRWIVIKSINVIGQIAKWISQPEWKMYFLLSEVKRINCWLHS